MSNGRVAALSEGLTYQGIIFWQNAFETLLTDSDIAAVEYEEGKSSPCDDVVVYYKKSLYEEDLNFRYNTDYFQCKFKVDNSKPIKFIDLMNPDYYGNTESFLKRAFSFYTKLENKEVRLFLYTTTCQDNSDVFFKNISKINNGLLLDKLINKKQCKKVFALLQKQLGSNESETLDFLSKLRFCFGKSIEEERKNLNLICKSLGISYDRSKMGDSLSEILRKLNLSRMTSLDQARVRRICISNDLWVKKENNIGIISYDFKDDKTKTALSQNGVLDLSRFFDRKRLKVNITWDDIKKEIEIFCGSIKFDENYLITLSAIYSVCFAVGKQLGKKIANITFNNKGGIYSENLFEQLNEQETEDVLYSENSTEIDDAILVFSFNNDIAEDVRDYLKEQEITKSAMLVQKNKSEKHTISNNEFWNGVLSFCKNAKEFIKRNKPERIHIFYSGPAEGAFVIGQYAKEWGECTVYEFNFGAAPREQKYIKGITI